MAESDQESLLHATIPTDDDREPLLVRSNDAEADQKRRRRVLSWMARRVESLAHNVALLEWGMAFTPNPSALMTAELAHWAQEEMYLKSP